VGPELKRGDEVAIVRRDEVLEITTVAHVGSREYRLADGSRWLISTRLKVGSTGGLFARRLRKAAPNDAKACADLRKTNGLRHRMKHIADWDRISLGQLERIASILDEKAEPVRAVGA
jgi:hypothetical protein